ncbi:MAG: hypothetical protein ACJ0BT_03670 [Pseudohongiellaceae bacterium]
MWKKTILTTVIFFLLTTIAFSQEERLAGSWVINKDLSEITDDKVELALIASGATPTKGFFNRDREYYRGGPVEQEIYDFISYELTLDISIEQAVYTFQYGEFTRLIYLDNRGNSVSLSGLDEVQDFSFGHWENNKLIIEGRPRDNGFTNENYSLSDDGMQLNVELYIKPRALNAPVELIRIYDRVLEK